MFKSKKLKIELELLKVKYEKLETELKYKEVLLNNKNKEIDRLTKLLELKENENNKSESSYTDYSEPIDEEMYDEVVKYALEQGKISASMIQRRFRLGYNRAAQTIDMLEERGVIGPMTGSKPREIILGKETKNNLINSDEELYEEAVNFVIEAGKASTSLLQRKFKIGYSKAARFIDKMEENGIVGPHKGTSAPRDVLITKEGE